MTKNQQLACEEWVRDTTLLYPSLDQIWLIRAFNAGWHFSSVEQERIRKMPKERDNIPLSFRD